MTALTLPSLDNGEPLASVPAGLALADWRRRVATLYAEVRAIPEPKKAWEHWRSVRSELYKVHPMSPVPEEGRAAWHTIPMFDYNPDFRFEVETVPADGPSEAVSVGDDGTLSRRPVARTQGLADNLGTELTLWWIGGYGGGLFLPFADATSGGETYGGGRYLLDAIKGADLGFSNAGRLLLDFNFAYTPSCALNTAYICPLSPPENRLATPIHVGERIV